MTVLDVRERDGVTWYRRGAYWYKTPSGSAIAYELRVCAYTSCRREFFGQRGPNRQGSAGRCQFCSRACWRSALCGQGHHLWRGDDVGYRGGHIRVAKQRGKASSCSVPGCPTAEGHPAKFHWASLTGNFADPEDYMAMCVFHHRAFDWAKILGMGVQEALERIAAIPAEFQLTGSAKRCV